MWFLARDSKLEAFWSVCWIGLSCVQYVCKRQSLDVVVVGVVTFGGPAKNKRRLVARGETQGVAAAQRRGQRVSFL